MNFYKFLNTQIMVMVLLTITTGAWYIYMGFIYGTLMPSLIWYMTVLFLSFWGYRLHREFLDSDLNIQEKEDWQARAKKFLFIYFSLWTVIFLINISSKNIEHSENASSRKTPGSSGFHGIPLSEGERI